MSWYFAVTRAHSPVDRAIESRSKGQGFESCCQSFEELLEKICVSFHAAPVHLGALDAKSKDLRFRSHCWSCVEMSGKFLIPYYFCLPSALMGTSQTEVVSEWLKLPAYLYGVCAVFSQGRWGCSSGVYPTPGKVTCPLNMVQVYLYHCHPIGYC